MANMKGEKNSAEQKQKRVLASERHKARHYAMQGLYQWYLTGASASAIEAQFRVDFDMKGTDLEYFRTLLKGVQLESDDLDNLLSAHAEDRVLDECDPVTRSLLRMSAFELKNRIDVPYKVALNEAVNLAKKFGPADSHKFVNGLLDKLAAELRAVEFNANKS